MAFDTDLSQGTITYVWVKDEWDPGASSPKARGNYADASDIQFLKVDTNTLGQDGNLDIDDTMSNSRDSDTSIRLEKFKVGGQVGHRLFQNNGRILRRKAIGMESSGATITADTVHAITTTGRLSVITLTTGTAMPELYRPFAIDTGAGMEIRSALAVDLGTKKVTVGLLTRSHAVDDTCAVTFFAAKLEAPYSRSSGYDNLLGTVSMGEVPGNKYERRYRDGYVGKWDIKSTGGKTQATAEIMFNQPRFAPGDWGTSGSQTSYDPTDSSLADIPFNNMDTFMVFSYDEEGAGTSQLELVDLAEEWNAGIDNKLEEADLADRRPNKRYFVGASRVVQAGFKVRNPSSYPVAHEDFFLGNKNTVFVVEMAQNIGTPSTPIYQCTTIAIPNMRYSKAGEVKDIKTMIGEMITGQGVQVGTQEKIYVWSGTSS